MSTTPQQISLAERHYRAGQIDLAESLLREVIARDPMSAKAYELLAYICGNRQELAACEDYLQQASALPECSAEALFYLGRVQLQRGRAREALGSFGRSIELAGDYFEGLHELGVAHSVLGEHEQALAAFRRAERRNPRSHELQSNLAHTLAALRHFGAALRHCDRALALDPRLVGVWTDRGAALTELGRGPEALESYQRALALAPGDVSAWMNRATTLTLLKRHAEALACYEEVGRLAPQTDYLRGHRLHAAMSICRWDDWAQRVDDTLAQVDAGEKAATPFSLLSVPAGPATLLTCAYTYARDLYPARPAAVDFVPRAPGRKLRVAYFSTDFRDHPISQLIVRVLECHDRTRFEWFGFSLGPPTPDEMNARISAALDHVTNVADRSDAEIAAMARAAGIDIAVDLNGFTEGCRPHIFAHRAAPVQVNYLGFPGTMGCDYIDYVLADATVIPPEEYGHYAEKVVVLPGSYQPNDNTKRIDHAVSTRECMGLPLQAFVFACFNNNYKITPDVFDVWMRLLRNVPGSVLWLLKSNDDAQLALENEARSRGIDPARIVWAGRMALGEHLARHVHADLFLDTFHYNAHTTCSDALWGGLPVLTLSGATFASRVCASLLGAVGLPELVTHSVAEYESLALSLATSPQRLGELRRRLHGNRTTMPLFDSPLFARRIEAAFDAMWDRHRQGLSPDHIQVEPEA
ncbi:MAG: tetratricopeptide repeat protein [Variovorax sp.]|nr:MAG: tetratricopeptide repeat protein [Variovorax sp.]